MSDRNPFDINGWIEQKVQEQLAPVNDWLLLRLRRKVDEEIHRLRGHHHHHHPRQITLLQPTLTNLEGEPIMASYSLKTNVVAHFVLVLTNPATGSLDPVDPVDVFSVTSSDPTNLEAVIGTNASGQTEVAVRWLHKTNPMLIGVGISISDSAGNTSDNAETFDMVPPAFVPDQIGIDLAGVTETPQPDAV